MSELLTADGIARFSEAAAAHVGDALVPGLVALVARGDQVHFDAPGSLAVGGQPVRRDSLFRISSTSKPVTGAATLALATEGLLRLDEPVDRLLPELANRRVLRRIDGELDDTVPADRAITVRDLLTFTFGFGAAAEMFMAAEPWPVQRAESRLHLATLGPPSPAEPPDPDTWIAALGSLPLLAQPGQRWLYNTGAQVLSVLAARAAGVPFPEVLRTRIFEPLGMRDTGFWASDTGRLATAYQPTPDGLRVLDPPDGAWSRPQAFPDGAAGLVSTADDLLAFARMLLRGGDPVLPAGAVAQMTSDQLTPEQKASAKGFLGGSSWGFCQAVVTEGPREGAYGWAGGLGTTWLVDPARDLTVIVLTQRMFESPAPPQVHTDLQAAAYAAVPPPD
jgi:CubicO group peptidase (beta-lactamase class C family)